MTDPYKILEVSRDATMDDIKKQYRALSRKYHPDSNINNPNKDLAEEKFKEIQSAYQQIVYEREHGYSEADNYQNDSSSGYGNFYSGQNSYGYEDFGDFFGAFRNYRGNNNYSSNENQYYRAAREYINAGRYREALNVLSNIAQDERTGEWYYLSAVCNLNMGNNVAATEHARTAINIEPGNYDYRRLYEALESGSAWYDSRSSRYGMSNGFKNICTWCIILNCCCGGNGIWCCI